MSTSARISDTLEDVRPLLVEDLYKVGLTVGFITVASASYRNLLFGLGGHSIVLFGFLVMLGIFHLARRHVSYRLRGILIIAVLIYGGLQALIVLGVAGPGSFLLPTATILAWMIVGARGAWATALAALLGFAACFWTNAHHKTIPISTTDMNSQPLFWFQLGVVLILVAFLLLVMVRRLVLALSERRSEMMEERDHVSGILEGISEALFVHEIPGGQILETNRRAEEMFGVSRETLFRSKPFEFTAGVSPWSEAEGREVVRRALEQGPQQEVWRARRGDGTLFWSEMALRFLQVGDAKRLLVTVRDIEDRVQDKLEVERLNSELEARVLRRTATLEQSRKDLQAFSFAVSHDLRAPLRAIDGFAKVLQEDHQEILPEEGRMAIGRILAGASRMNRLIDALLDLSQIDRRPIRRIPVNMEKMVREQLEELSAGTKIEERSIAWHVGSIQPSATDPDLVRQIWANLLGNACKFSRDAAQPCIQIASEQRGDGIWYTVTDNGCGFDMNHAGKLFGMFQRMHDSSIDGLGIGLATVKRILNRLDGEIEFEGRPGLGATFRFRPSPSVLDETNGEIPEIRG